MTDPKTGADAEALLEKQTLNGTDVLRYDLAARSGPQLTLDPGWSVIQDADESNELLRQAA